MKTQIFLFLFTITSSAIIESKDDDKKDKERNLMMMLGNNMVSPPLVSPPPPIFDTGQIPIMPVHNLIHYPHQYSSPLVDYMYPTVFNPFYNNILPYGMSQLHNNPQVLNSMGTYGMNPYAMSMYSNGMYGMVPYQNSQISGISSINNNMQNYQSPFANSNV